MITIGVPKEVKDNEYRVAIIPEQVAEIAAKGRKIYVQKGAGEGSGFSDEEYEAAGAKIIENPAMIWKNADLILKVKEPAPQEYDLMSRGQIIFTFFHLPANRGLYEAMKEKGITAVAYETVELPDGSLPILRAMSEIAGKVAVDVARFLLQKENGGAGILLEEAKITVLGLGNAGKAALLRLPASEYMETRVLDRKITSSENKSPQGTFYSIPACYSKTIFLPANAENIENAVTQSDVVICSVAAVGEKTPKLISRELVKKMKRGSVLIDISIDQGGCSETSRPTTHSKPTFVEEGVVHYCVTNMPGVVPRTSTLALSKEVFPFLLDILEEKWAANPALRKGINLWRGELAHRKIADCFQISYIFIENIFKGD